MSEIKRKKKQSNKPPAREKEHSQNFLTKMSDYAVRMPIKKSYKP